MGYKGLSILSEATVDPFICFRLRSLREEAAPPQTVPAVFQPVKTDNTTKVHPCGIDNKSKNKDREMTGRDSVSLLAWGSELCMLFCSWPEVVQSV